MEIASENTTQRAIQRTLQRISDLAGKLVNKQEDEMLFQGLCESLKMEYNVLSILQGKKKWERPKSAMAGWLSPLGKRR